MAEKGKIVNKKARYEYEIGETVEAGLVLMGIEVKSLRMGRGSIKEAFVRVTDGEAFLVNADIPGYGFADLRDYDSRRTRKLLLHTKEIEAVAQRAQGKSMSLIPLSIYLKKGKFKLLVGVGKGRREYEKKEVKKKRDLEREVKKDWKEKLR